MIQHPSNSDVQWFCDANVFIAPTDFVVWDSLFGKKDRLVLAIPIYHELEQWLSDPNNNLAAHAAVQGALNGANGSVVRLLDFPRNDVEKATSMEYYTNLIGMRKKAHFIAEEKLAEKLGRQPTKQETSNYTKDQVGMRAQLIARKGDEGRVAQHKFNDEALLIQAISDAIYTGTETSILTYDEDVLEQFYKALWLIDTHYRSMLFAERYSRDPFAFQPTRRVQDSRGEAFDGEVLLLRKPSDDLTELLPSDWTPVSIHCILVKNKRLTKLSFCAEREISQLFDVKARTGGLNTDKCEGSNCHVYLGDRFVEKVGNWAVIGRDHSSSRPEWLYKLSVVDVNLAVMSDERFIRSRVVDPSDLILPPDYRE